MKKKNIIKIVISVAAVIVICVAAFLIIKIKSKRINIPEMSGISEEKAISILDKNKYEYKRRTYEENLIDLCDEMSINNVNGKYTIEIYQNKVIFVKSNVDISKD